MNKKNIVILISTFVIIIVLAIGVIYGSQYWEESSQQNIYNNDQVSQNESTSIDSYKKTIYSNEFGNYSMMIEPKVNIDTSNPNCIAVSNEIGSVVIASGTSETPCGVTGLGIDSEPIEDYTINIGDKVVGVRGFRNTVDNTGFVSFTLSDQVSITLVIEENKSNTEQEFQENLSKIEKFLIEDLMFKEKNITPDTSFPQE
ncbi:hypothetical protein EBU71_02670 [bacterium]|nr:hypothetical protein [Candidatus Elulimicrobium humile]